MNLGKLAACAVVSLLSTACGDDTTGSGGGTTSSSTVTSGPGATTTSGSTSTVSTNGSTNGSTTTGGGSMMNFFVTSDTRPSGDFGGLAGADQRCQDLAAAVGEGSKTWRAYLSAEDPPTNARDRIGPGPYYNAAGVMVAADSAALHAMVGDATLILTESGGMVNGQWDGSPDPNEHDIMTGSAADGTLDGSGTCDDWTSGNGSVRVGHSDGLGPNANPDPPYSSWNSSHDGSCGDPASTGGAAKIYCFVGP